VTVASSAVVYKSCPLGDVRTRRRFRQTRSRMVEARDAPQHVQWTEFEELRSIVCGSSMSQSRFNRCRTSVPECIPVDSGTPSQTYSFRKRHPTGKCGIVRRGEPVCCHRRPAAPTAADQGCAQSPTPPTPHVRSAPSASTDSPLRALPAVSRLPAWTLWVISPREARSCARASRATPRPSQRGSTDRGLVACRRPPSSLAC